MAKYEYKVKGVDYVVEIQDIEGNIANVTVNGIPFEVEMKQPVKSSKQKVKLTDGQNNISASSVQAQVLLQVQVLQQVLILLHQANRQLLLQANQLLPLCLALSTKSR